MLEVASYPYRGYTLMVSHRVVLADEVAKGLARLPRHIRQKLLAWVDAVERYGLAEVRKIPGFHDEPLKGERAGQRSIRLSRAYRAIYRVIAGSAQLVRIEEVNKHRY